MSDVLTFEDGMTNLIKPHISDFTEILTIIRTGRSSAFQAANLALIETYWASFSPNISASWSSIWKRWIVM
ncbi:MAG: hypothetical protein ACYDHC_07880 [Desulfuromonadaceae bacterium]